MSYDVEPFKNNSTSLTANNNTPLDEINRTAEKTDFDRTQENSPCRPNVEVHNQLEDAFDYSNLKLFYPHFGVCLPHVIFSTPKSIRYMGYFERNLWNKETAINTKASEIALNSFFLNNPLKTCKTLVHEMMHLGQAEYPEIFGKPGKGGYHNKAFAKTMIKVGLMPSSTGKKGGAMTGVGMSEYIIPGGPFDLAFQEYLSTGDKFTWFVQLDTFETTGGQTGWPGNSANGTNTASERKRRSKSKYTCPTCALNAWAKPGVDLVCGTCSVRLVAKNANPTQNLPVTSGHL